MAKTAEGVEKSAADAFRKEHWENLFRSKTYTDVLWHQTTPAKSLAQIERFAQPDDAIIDVGCGASLLVDNLIAKGYRDLCLLDASEASLQIVRDRLASDADIPVYVCSDIVNLNPQKQFRVWHDRAMFHFLQDATERRQYFEIMHASLLPGGTAVINTFAADGETECAGLSTIRYDRERMAAELPVGLQLIEAEDFVHTTPKNTAQNYAAFYIRKTC
ncbi:methyltransferase domain-containing protein [Sulfurimonas sp. HSL-3221]|uniref:class I SAM-dependent methyltransferase n=1 Tax=Sulfurimonadaceae TaxID=2771471 RepID=UPI001E3F1E10|nr:methyltransferase domain-containing protein [Sulfurimonas sp. HSL-3221]UFS61975.1 methyltransferase domain-containing protein [Sulfurimonas sp. HSL-3221]